MNRVVLASRSPQRLALLTGLGLDPEVVEPAIDELSQGEPREVVAANAASKAVAVASRPGLDDAIVVAGDTEVVLDGAVLGQPADEAKAREMLSSLSGREHEVVGGLCVIVPGEREPRVGVEETLVAFRDLDGHLIESALASGEWRGRAGGYAIQGVGSGLVERVEGDLSNVIGLPLSLLARLSPELLRLTRQN